MIHTVENLDQPMLKYGVMGTATMIPKGFTIETVIVARYGRLVSILMHASACSHTH